jgi:hypothetical protein
MEKHNVFMKKIIGNMIRDNEKQQINLQKYKKNYQPPQTERKFVKLKSNNKRGISQISKLNFNSMEKFKSISK